MFYEKELWQYLKNADKPIVLYGMGNGADKIIAVLEEYGIPLRAYLQVMALSETKSFMGLRFLHIMN